MTRDPDDGPASEGIGTEPTLPATDMRKSGLNFMRERPNAFGGQGSGSSTTWVIVGLIVAVAAGFWWLTDRAHKAATPQPQTQPAPVASKPVATTPVTPKPQAPLKHVAAPAPAPPAQAKPTTADDDKPAAVAKPAETHKAAHKKKHAKKAKATTTKLPRLPSPPPADE